MVDGLVRVRVNAAGRDEIIRVSTQHVAEYLETHPGAVALDDDWRPEAMRAARAAEKKDEK